MKYTYEQLAKMIDHSLLHPTMTDQELEDGCKLAAKYGVASVCIKPYAAKRAGELLKGTGVLVGCVVGFTKQRWPAKMELSRSTWSLTSARL
jgi:deoxyribose-phosphate aldolase